MNPTLIDAIARFIDPAERLLIITHLGPDGDAIGSLLGLGGLLRDRGKQVTLACQDPVPAIYTWLPGSADVVRGSGAAHDRVISVDCSDLRRLGTVYHERLASLPLLNIDHHVTNTEFGSLNWVDPAAVATAQMILALADALGWLVTPPVATCLLAGLVTDTRSFRTPNVDPAALRAALRLMEAGASLHEVAWRSLDQQPLAYMRLWAGAIDRLELADEIMWTEVTRAMRERLGLSENDTSGLSNLLSSIREAQVSVLFTERNDGTIDVSMRAVAGLDVAQVALKLGGGGHPQAAGCTLPGDLDAVKTRVLAEVRGSIEAQRQAAAGPEAMQDWKAQATTTHV